MRENGENLPETVTLNAINQCISRRGYSAVITLGSSKGGTAALYFGLKLNASDIIIGACQYRIGSYLANYPEIFKAMTGHDVNDTDIESLDAIMPCALKEHKHLRSHIHLIHSVKEPTYERDIKYLIRDLNSCGFEWTEFECGFKQHNEVGQHFPPIASGIIKKIQSDICKK